MSLFFSIIIPVYNRPELLMRTLNSVKNQSFKDFEIVLVDDASSEDIDSIVKLIKKNDPGLNLVFRSLEFNQGVNVAKNFGIKLSKGRFLVFLDSDDIFLEDESLQKIYNILCSKNYPAVSMFASVYLSGLKKCVVLKEFIKLEDYLKEVNKGEYLPVVERCAFDRVKFDPLIRGGEGLTWLNLSNEFGSVFFCSEVIRVYDDLSVGRMSNFSREYFLRIYKIYSQKLMLFKDLGYRLSYSQRFSLLVKLLIYRILSFIYLRKV